MLANLSTKNFLSISQKEQGMPAEDGHELELVRCIAAKNEAALRELYAAYGQRLYAYALHLTGDPAQAEDVVQEMLVAVWRSADKYRGEGRLLAWLLGI